MKQYIYIIILSLITTFLCNCNSKTSNPGNSIDKKATNAVSRQDSINKIENSIFPIYFDKNKNYEEKIYTLLHDIGKVEYIKLETNDSCLISVSSKLTGVRLTDQDIFISMKENIFRFDRKGKFINSIGKIGQGPWEIIDLRNFFVDEKKQEVHILDGVAQSLKTYDFNGQAKNKIRFEAYGSEIGAVCDSFIICTNFIENNQPMTFLSSLNNGKTVKQILPVCTDGKARGLSVRFYDKFTHNLLYNNKVIYQNFINDTIYTIDRKNFTASPRYIQLPPNTGLDGNNTSPFIAFETDRYAYIVICKKEPLNYNFVIDKKENKIYKGFIGDGELGIAITPINTNKDNVIADLYDTFTLQDRLSKNKLRGSLKEIAETLGDDDNPILMIATIDF